MLQSMGLSCGSQPLRWTLIASVVDIPKAGAVKFTYRQEGLSREGFLFLFKGEVQAFENSCRHIPIPLDYGDCQFFNSERSQIICQNHGARFEPLTGLCVQGPCEGAFLNKLPVCLEEGKVYLRVLV
ncbi:MAG: Rieske 2Fe-2S domain-containing protein [Verrucomicrobia bacterium]|nr:MAG: Rieske 2Fe-2S domain-containing protein [Verrucomicrobiota bacterium]